MKIVELNKQPTELHKILKFEGLVDSGGTAKNVIAEGLVNVNGKVETQKRKKIMHGDVIEFNGESFEMQVINTSIKPQE